MLTLERRLKLDKETVLAPNLSDRFEDSDLKAIGNAVYDGYVADKYSRWKWEKRTQAAMDLALQVQKDKNFPWPGCSNVAFPLITIAALQFHSRAYPALLSSTDIVKCRLIGEDQDGLKTARAGRISVHMSWQMLEEDQSWEEQQDRLLINLPIVGCAFKKTYHDSLKAHNVGELVLAQDLVIDYYAKSVEACPRKTHIIPMFRNEVRERILRRTFRDVSKEAWYENPPSPTIDKNTIARDNRIGRLPPPPDETTPFLCLEQHVDIDLDGDGYAEPYIITIEESSKSVLRIVTGFDQISEIDRTKDGEIISVRAMQYFTKYSFIPSPDGGIYDMGFGVLLGPLNESTDSIVNQLIDAGTMQNTKGGFLGRGAKIRGGVYTFAPLEWKRVDSSGDDLRKNIVPLEVGEPSLVLFQLLSLLINYVQRISGTTDPLVGEPTGQNTPAETTRAMIQEGMKIYSAIFKRVWRSMKEEFKKGYVLNGIYMPRRKSFGSGQLALREDYLGNPNEVVPSADPNVASEQMQLVQAQMLKQAAMSTPGYDPDAVERRYLKALKIDAIDQIYPGVAKTGMPKDVKLQIAELKLQGEQTRLQSEQQQFLIEMMEEQRVNNANIAKIAAEIQNMTAVTEGDKDDRKIALLNAMLGMMKLRNETLTKAIDVKIKELELKRAKVDANAGDVSGLGGASGNGGAKKRSATVSQMAAA